MGFSTLSSLCWVRQKLNVFTALQWELCWSEKNLKKRVLACQCLRAKNICNRFENLCQIQEKTDAHNYNQRLPYINPKLTKFAYNSCSFQSYKVLTTFPRPCEHRHRGLQLLPGLVQELEGLKVCPNLSARPCSSSSAVYKLPFIK